jgi:hypothetical protein
MDEIDEENKKKIETFFKEEMPVHIVTHNNRWINGYIKEIKPDFFVLEEFKTGRLLIFFSEIWSLESYREIIKDKEKKE